MIAETDLRLAERAHYRLQSALYIPFQQDLGNAKLCWSDVIDDTEWNHVGLVDVAPEDCDRLLLEAGRLLTERGRAPAVAISPFSTPADLSKRLTAQGFHPAFEHSWLFYPAKAAGIVSPSYEKIYPLGTEDLGDFVRVFNTTFGAEEEPGFALAIQESVTESPAGLEVVHFLATWDGVPVGISTLIHDGEVGGLYNLGVVPAARRQGLGRRLTLWRVREARRRGCRLIFLQTEKSAVERWQKNAGFVPGFSVQGWSQVVKDGISPA